MVELFPVSLFLLSLCTFILAQNDEFYCKKQADQWKVCRTCNDSQIDCDGTSQSKDGCRCEDISIAHPSNYNFNGGWDSCQTNGWCYIKYRKNKVCSDQKWAGDSDRFLTDPNVKGKPYIWLKQGSELGKSKEACTGKQYNTGNEAILEGVKITGNAEDLEFDFETSDDCKDACSSRIGECGSWSFDKSEGICYLHTPDSCCGQFGKREKNLGFTSGYVCQYCWSTKTNTDCPCSIEERSQRPGTAHSSGGDNHCTGEMELHPNFITGNQRKPKPFRKIIKRKGRYFRTAEWKIWKNAKGKEGLKTEKATLLDGNCCWTITGSRREEILLNYRNPVAELDFYVKKVKSHKCSRF